MSSLSLGFNLGHPRFWPSRKSYKGFAGLLLSRTRIQIYWPVIGWAFLVLLVCFEYWWSMFRMRTHHDWTFSTIRNNGVADDPHLHGRRIGFSRFPRGSQLSI